MVVGVQAAADFNAFFGQALPQFIQQTPQLTSQQQQLLHQQWAHPKGQGSRPATDLASFCSAVDAFMADCACFRCSNGK